MINVICVKYRKFKKPKTSYIFEKTLVVSIICSKCKNEDQKMFKEEDQLKKYSKMNWWVKSTRRFVQL